MKAAELRKKKIVPTLTSRIQLSLPFEQDA